MSNNKIINLDLNEYDFKHPDEFYELLNETINKDKIITHYTYNQSDNTTILLNKIALYNNILENNIILTPGSDTALEYIINTYVNNYTKVFLFYPTYFIFEMMVKIRTKNIDYINIDIRDNDYNIDKYLKNYNLDSNSIVYIVSPNNPIGNIINITSLETYLKNYKSTIFIIDEAYIEFSKKNTCIELIKKYDNLIVSRSFSKAYGLAGLRLGYIASSNIRCNEIYKIYNERSLTELTKIAGIFIMENINHYENIINKIIIERQLFEIFLKENDIYYISSNSNFILFYVGDKYNDLLIMLKNNNIIIRNKNNEIKGFLRITIGNHDNMNFVKEKFKENLHLFDKYN